MVKASVVLSFVAITVLMAGLLRAAADAPANGAFFRTWSRTDKPVAERIVDRTWMWGPEAFTAPIVEDYANAPGGKRVVQYFDKSRMEDNAYRGSDPWDVTNGLLVVEMVEGYIQIGDDAYDESPESASVNIAGDPGEQPSYADIDTCELRSTDGIDAEDVGTPIIATYADRCGLGSDTTYLNRSVTRAVYVPETGHTIASPFWAFMNSSGTIWDGSGYTQSSLFQSPYYATGFPVTEAWWSRIAVGGVTRDVLWQCFERRCLTYTPDNAAGWQVEAGNAGRHYFEWRYADDEPEPVPTSTRVSPATPTTTPITRPSPPATASPSPACHPSYPDFCIPPPPPDLNCSDFTAAQRPFAVRHDVPDPDPHDLDGDKNGIACTG